RATGTPASGASRHRSGSRSIASARASARSATTVLNAWSSGSSAAILSSASRHTSTAERSRARIASRVARAFIGWSAIRNPQSASSRSNDPGHPEEAGVEGRVGSVGESGVAIEAGARLVRAVGILAGEDAGGRRDAGGIDLLHGFCVAEEFAELAGEQVHFRGIELEVGEGGDLRNIFPREKRRHVRC